MALNPGERAEVAHKLLLSLEPPATDAGVDEAWATEIRARLQAVRSGSVPLRDWDDALASIRRAITS
jgi:putative addiction module component (TIGR02574 family)